MNAIDVDVRFGAFAADGDPADLAAVFDALAPDLLLLAAHVAWSGTDAEDLVQTTFLTAIERCREYDPSRPVRPWLVGILVNHARTSNRKIRRELLPEGLVQPTSSNPANELETKEVLQCVADAIKELPEHYRQVLHLRFVHGMQLVQIASALGLPSGTAKARMSRGTELLRSRLPSGVGGVVLVGLTCSPERLLAMRSHVLSALTAAPAKVIASGFGARMLVALLLMVLVAVPVAWAAIDDPAPVDVQAAGEHALDSRPVGTTERVAAGAHAGQRAAVPRAQPVLANSPELKQGEYTVRGRLVDAEGGKALRGQVAIVPTSDFVNLMALAYTVLSKGSGEQAPRLAGATAVGPDGAFEVHLEGAVGARFTMVAVVAERGRVVHELGTLIAKERDLGDVTVPRATLLRLRVVDELDQPVAGARVMLAPPGKWQVIAGRAGGHAVVRETASDAGEVAVWVAPGPYELRMADDHRLVSSPSFEVMAQPVQLEEVRLARLQATSKLSGLVVDPDGVPLAGMEVQLFGRKLPVLTDANGQFEVAVPDSFSKASVTVEDPSGTRFDTVHADYARPLKPQVVITMQPLRGLRIAVVSRATGEPIQRFALLDFGVLVPSTRVRDHKNGLVSMPPAGGATRSFVVIPSGHEYMPTSIRELPGNDDFAQKVAVHKRVTMRVRVLDADGDAVPGSTVELLDPMQTPIVGNEEAVYPDELRSSMMRGRVLAVSEGTSDADGWAELDGGLGTTGMVLRIRGRSHAPLLVRDVVVTQREEEVVVSPGATVSGTLGDADVMKRMFQRFGPKRAMFGDAGANLAPYGVFLTRGDQRLPARAATYPVNKHGAFHAQGVPPGSWGAHLWLPTIGGRFGVSYRIGSIEALQPAEQRAFECTVHKLVFGSVTGTVWFGSRPLANHDVTLQLEGKKGEPCFRRQTLKTDGDGRLQGADVLAGTYRVIVDRTDDDGHFQRVFLPERVRVESGKEARVRLVIRERRARLLVLASDGKPLAGARIGVSQQVGSGMISPEHMITDAEGRLETTWVPDGPFQYHVQSGSEWVPFDFELPASEVEVDWTLRLQ